MMRMHVREVHLAVRGRGKWFPHCASDGPVAANTLCYSFVLVYLYSCICLLCIFYHCICTCVFVEMCASDGPVATNALCY